MEIARGNRAIANHASDGRELHLFKKAERGGLYRYLGQFKYAGHEAKQGSDVDGSRRNLIVFRLEIVQATGTGGKRDLLQDTNAESVSPEWDEEIASRINDLEQGRVHPIPWDEA